MKHRVINKKLLSAFTALLAVVLAVSPVLAQDFSPGEVLVNFTVQNLDDTGEAQVFVNYINADNGDVTQIPSGGNPQIIPAESSFGFAAADSGLPSGFNGSAIVSSDKETAAFGQMLWQNGTGTNGDGRVAAAYEAFRQGAQKLYFPSLAARPSAQYSELTIQSAETADENSQVSVTVTFYTRDGAEDTTRTLQIPKGQSRSINLASIVQQNDTGNTLRFTEPDGWLGSATAECTCPLAGVAVTHWKAGYTGSYSGMTEEGAASTGYVASVSRRFLNGNWLQWSGVIVQNLDPDTDAEVTVTWYDRNNVERLSFPDTIPANSSHGFNTRFPDTSNVPGNVDLPTALGNDYLGSVVVESTNGVEIVVVANGLWSAQSALGLAATAYTSQATGFDKLYVPGTFRRVTGGNNWLQYTGLIVQNVAQNACNDFTVEWRDREGNERLTFTDSLPGRTSHGYNTRFPDTSEIPAGANVNNLGDDYRGGVVITAPGCQLVAIHNTLWPAWTESTTYNAFGR